MIQRYKNRYVLVESSFQSGMSDRHAESEIIGAMAAEMGNTGFLEANPKIVHRPSEYTFIMRINRGYERKAVLALSFVRSVGGKKAALYTIKTSGTIRSLIDFCRKAYAQDA